MSENFATVADIRRNSGWREALEERQNYEHERRKRELAEAEKKQQQVRKAREAEKQQAASNNWWVPIDDRINEHLKNWLWVAIDDRIRQNLELHFFSGNLGVGGAVIGGIGDALGEKVAQLRKEFKHAIEEEQRSFEAKLAEQKERLLASNSDGAQGRAELRAEIKSAFEQMCSTFGSELAALEQRVRATPGRLPVVKSWKPETVFYAGDVVTCDGSLFQASRDTGQSVTHADWICLARAGRDGHDGLTPNFRAAYNAHKTYTRLDVVEYDGAGYLARRDAPGVPGIPGDGWQLMSRAGRRGATGEVGPRGRKGEKGEKGAKGDAPEIVSWHLERETYRAFPVLADGKMGPELNLRPLFEQFFLESHAAE